MIVSLDLLLIAIAILYIIWYFKNWTKTPFITWYLLCRISGKNLFLAIRK